MLAGEALSARAANDIVRALGAERLANIYGPTEATVYAAAWFSRSGAAGGAPIGGPLRHTPLYVLDAGLRPVAPGVAGGPYIAGEGLGPGYPGPPGPPPPHPKGRTTPPRTPWPPSARRCSPAAPH
ncbi:AMP-binding protein, partial [Streptomyces varsoviensis]|uniref:AMP-binding protein n=1 Tax=Streptomyces varsoviensis TaxID=67373 RepID=UPI003D1542CF